MEKFNDLKGLEPLKEKLNAINQLVDKFGWSRVGAIISTYTDLEKINDKAITKHFKEYIPCGVHGGEDYDDDSEKLFGERFKLDLDMNLNEVLEKCLSGEELKFAKELGCKVELRLNAANSPKEYIVILFEDKSYVHKDNITVNPKLDLNDEINHRDAIKIPE